MSTRSKVLCPDSYVTGRLQQCHWSITHASSESSVIRCCSSCSALLSLLPSLELGSTSRPGSDVDEPDCQPSRQQTAGLNTSMSIAAIQVANNCCVSMAVCTRGTEQLCASWSLSCSSAASTGCSRNATPAPVRHYGAVEQSCHALH